MIRLFVTCDNEGNIIESVAGQESLVPLVGYGVYFELDSWDIPMNIEKYKVSNGKLVLKI